MTIRIRSYHIYTAESLNVNSYSFVLSYTAESLNDNSYSFLSYAAASVSGVYIKLMGMTTSNTDEPTCPHQCC